MKRPEFAVPTSEADAGSSPWSLRPREPWIAGALAAIGFCATIGFAGARSESVGLAPWAVGWALFAALSCRQGALAQTAFFPIAASTVVGVGLLAWMRAEPRRTDLTGAALLLAVIAGYAALFQVAAAWTRASDLRRRTWWAAAIAAGFALWTLVSSGASAPRIELLFVLALAVCAAVAANGTRSSVLFVLATLAIAYAQAHQADRAFGAAHGSPHFGLALSCLALGAAFFTLWPFVRRTVWAVDPIVWRVAAASNVLWFYSLRRVWEEWLGASAIGLVPSMLAVFASAGVWLVQRSATATDVATPAPALRTARVWYASIALFWLSLAVPLQLDQRWVLVGFAFAGGSLAWLARRLEHRPLVYIASALIALATFGLVMTRVAGVHAIHTAKLVNWLAWLYLAPAAAAVLAAKSIASLDGTDTRSRDAAQRGRTLRWAATLCGLCAATLVFAWLNLAILNAFGTRPELRWPTGRFPARDLTMSLAWALYALALLVLGVSRKVGAMRWISLGLVLLTIAKVFLFDLGNLTGLYRVASLAGLALALFLVSLLYQKFVFRRAHDFEPSPDHGPGAVEADASRTP